MASDRSVLERQIERVELGAFTLDGFHRRRQRKQRNRRVGSALVALLLAGAAIGGLLRALSSGTVPAGDPRARFLGTWVATDPDGSNLTMEISPSGDAEVDIEGHDDLASVCSGAPSTTIGTGRVQSPTQLVITSPVLTCDDGSEPQALSGPPLEDQLRNLTFTDHPETDTLTDTFGVVWVREGAEVPTPEPTATAGMWPQATLEEVRQAQELADAGDPAYTWQVDSALARVLVETWDVEALPGDAEIFARFFEEELGWEEFRWGAAVASPDEAGVSEKGSETYEYEIVFVRCAPGRTNPLYPDDSEGRGCAPTIDESHYETVNLSVAQPVRHGPPGIWVVTGAETLPPIELAVPPSDAETTALLQGFLQARVDGEGAQEYVVSPEDAREIPLLYATTSGAPYERFEFELLDGPRWPTGWMDVKVRLFAENGETVVDQCLSMKRDETGRLGLVNSCQGGAPGTTETGRVIDSHSRLDGEVTFLSSPPWEEETCLGPCFLDLDDNVDERVYVLADVRPIEAGCEGGPAPADAEAVAQMIRSDPDLEATDPVAARIGGIDALRMDVVAATGASICQDSEGAGVLTEPNEFAGYDPGGLTDPVVVGDGDRMRLYLLDLPDGLSARTLAIVIVAPEASFDQLVEAAEPILDSFEFHTG